MPVKTSSRRSYYEGVIRGKFSTQREAIIELLKETGEPMSRRMISKVLNIEPGAVAGRVAALIESDIVIHAHHADDPHTGIRVEFVELVWPQEPEPAPEQLEMKL